MFYLICPYLTISFFKFKSQDSIIITKDDFLKYIVLYFSQKGTWVRPWFQITFSCWSWCSNYFYQSLIVVLALVDSCVVRRYKTSQISQRVTHKSSSTPQNVVRVFLLYVENLSETLNIFTGLGLFKILQKKKNGLVIFNWSSLILNRSRKAEPHFSFLQTIGSQNLNHPYLSIA